MKSVRRKFVNVGKSATRKDEDTGGDNRTSSPATSPRGGSAAAASHDDDDDDNNNKKSGKWSSKLMGKSKTRRDRNDSVDGACVRDVKRRGCAGVCWWMRGVGRVCECVMYCLCCAWVRVAC